MATTPPGNAFDQFDAPAGNAFDQFDAPAAAPSVFDQFDAPDIGMMSNIARGAGERAGTLAGNVAGFAATAGDRLEDNYPLGGLVWEGDSIIPSYKTGEEYAQWTAKEGTTNVLRAAQDELTNLDFGYKPRSTWEGVKSSDGGWDLAKNVGAFALEQGLVSVPDMAAIMALPTLPAYLASRTEEIAQERAKNDERTEPTTEDMAYAGSAALAVTALDRFGLGKMLAPFKNSNQLMKKIGTAALTETVTEGIQEGLESVSYTHLTLPTSDLV